MTWPLGRGTLTADTQHRDVLPAEHGEGSPRTPCRTALCWAPISPSELTAAAQGWDTARRAAVAQPLVPARPSWGEWMPPIGR